jgi:L-ribulose-5-phosphate 3-epimerase UlaE
MNFNYYFVGAGAWGSGGTRIPLIYSIHIHITTPRRYFYNDEFLVECFEKLHGTIVSCHLKDILLKPDYTFQLQECACGEGTLNLELYAQLASAENPHMPMIIEHLTTDEEYVASVKYVRERLGIYSDHH